MYQESFLTEVDSARRVVRVATASHKMLKRKGSLKASNLATPLFNIDRLDFICGLGCRDIRMYKLARCKPNSKGEGNLRRNLHKAVESRQLPVKISKARVPVKLYKRGKVKIESVDWPVLYLSDWLKCALEFGGQLVLAGHQTLDQDSWQSTFRTFWDAYRSVDPTHPLFEHAESLGLDTGLFFPYTIHGDEGRGRCRIPVMVESFSPLLTFNHPGHSVLKGCLGSTGLFLYFLIA